jgi:uncharacterized protein (TIGR04255 family)
MTQHDPFFGEAPERIPLAAAPLTGVLVQVSFEEIFSIAKKEFIANFQERVRAKYPLSQQDQNLVLKLSPKGPEAEATPNWRFFDEKKAWRVSLTTNFITLETRAYESRAHFVQQLKEVLLAVEETIQPKFVKRIGVRYVDRIVGSRLNRLEELVCCV